MSVANTGLVGVLAAGTSAMTFEVGSAYELLRGQVRGHAWGLPVGPSLTVAMVRDADLNLARTFLGLHAGVRFQLIGSERLDYVGAAGHLTTTTCSA